MTEQWLSRRGAVEMIRDRLNASVGRAEALLRRACTVECEVRYLNDDGVVSDWRFTFGISKDDLVDWLNQRSAPDSQKPLTSASKDQIRAEIRAVYHEAGDDPPNIKQLPKAVQPRLRARGLDASENHIAAIGDENEFKQRRRPAGKTIASQRR